MDRLKLAFVTPWPTQKSGIANYSYRIIRPLSRYFDIDVFVDVSMNPEVKLLSNPVGDVFTTEELDDHVTEYDKVLYEMGNNIEFHTDIYRKLREHIGIVELHDFALLNSFYVAYLKGVGGNNLYDALSLGYGKKGIEYYHRLISGEESPDIDRFPLAHALQKSSERIIVHNHYSAQLLDQCNNPPCVISHPCFSGDCINDESIIDTLRSKYEIRKEDILISCFGNVAAFKRPGIVVTAVRRLRSLGFPVKLVFWGEDADNSSTTIFAKKDSREFIRITGYLQNEEFQVAMKISDFIINLRYPTNGESSGTLCEALIQGKPVIVSDYAQFREYPDDVCWKLPLGEDEVPILVSYLDYLIRHPKVKIQLEQNAKQYAETVLNPVDISKEYADVICGNKQRT